MKLQPIIKRPCDNCPFRCDGKGIPLRPGRIDSIVKGLLEDDHSTFVCHKTLTTGSKTCAGALGVMAKLGRLPVIARLALYMNLITEKDIEASKEMVLDPSTLDLSETKTKRARAKRQKQVDALKLN